MSIAALSSTVTPDEIRAEVTRVLESSDFRASRQLTRFLNYIVDASLAGEADQIKERTVAIHALDRDASFDPRLDPIARMVAGKLRRALERYYFGAGADNPVRIAVPKGGYHPAFTSIEKSPSRGESRTALEAGRDGMTALPVLAVVPFVAFTQGVQERLLADSLAQDVCVGLSKFTWFEVIDYLVARSQVIRGEAPTAVASRLHADFCLTGTVRQQGESLRATVQLMDACLGRIIWADQFDLSATVLDVRVLDETTKRVVATIGGIFGVLAESIWRSVRQKSIDKLSASEAVLRNLHYQFQLADGIYPAAMKAAKQALKANPDFAWGWAAMATLHLDSVSLLAKGGSRDASEESMTCIRRALTADPTSSFAHWTLALHHLMHGSADEAVAAAETAVSFSNGSSFEIGAAGAVMSAGGDHERGQALITQALEVNARLPGWVHWGAAINGLKHGETESTLAATRRFSLPECFWDHILRATAFTEAGERKQARKAIQRARRLRPELAERPRELVAMIIQEPDVQGRVLDAMEASTR